MLSKIEKIMFIKTHPEACIPTQGTTGSAGYDLKSIENVIIDPNERVLVKTGLILEIPNGYEGQIRSRSGLAINHGIVVLNAPGTIDSDYRGEIKVILYNMGDKSFTIEPGLRIAQLVIAPYTSCDFEETKNLNSTNRGEGGFGSTGFN
jgi:dUTP pyrophosphatase